MTVLDRLTQIFRVTFKDEEIVVGRSTTAEDIEDWDSLTHVVLIMAVEKEFSIRFSASEIASLENVGDLITVIEAKNGGN